MEQTPEEKARKIFESGEDTSKTRKNNPNHKRRDDEFESEIDIDRELEEDKGEKEVTYESGLPTEQTRNESQEESIENYLVEAFGYVEGRTFDTAGNIDFIVNEGSRSFTYTLEDDFSDISIDGIKVPAFEVTDPDILETSIDNQVAYLDTEVHYEEGELVIQFDYDQNDWREATEEFADEVVSLEKDLGIYSGR